MALAVLVQIGLAGVGAFHASHSLADKGDTLGEHSFSRWFSPHIAVGYLLFLASIVLLILAAIGARHRLRWSALAFVLFLIQIPLAWLGDGVPFLGFLHPLNALAILAVVGSLAHAEWRGDRRAAAPRAGAAVT
jgi:hypothetical protein